MIKRTFLISTILILVLASFVLAIGTSTRENKENSNSIICEDKTDLRERIKCRLENKNIAKQEAYDSVEEACRGHNKTEACTRLYKNSAYCYEQENSTAKKRCFLKESGININAGGTFRAAPNDAKRNYVVLLLYELQERLEKMETNGIITSDQASSLIAKIVEIKRMTLAGEKRADIIVKINEFKKEYREVVFGRGSINRNNNSTNNKTINNNTIINNTIINNTIIDNSTNNNTGGNNS